LQGNIITVNGVTPKFGKNVFIANNATLTGSIVMGDDCSVWFQVVIRGDVNNIIIGNKVNIQDGAVIHGTIGRGDTILEDNVSIGHRAIIHGCHIKRNVLIGMGAIVIDDAIIESNVIVGAGSVVTQGMHLESGYIYAGVPARKIKAINQEQQEFYIQRTADAYVKYASYYQ